MRPSLERRYIKVLAKRATNLKIRLINPKFVDNYHFGDEMAALFYVMEKIDTLEADNTRFRRALEFYAKERIYVNVGVPSELYDDQGKRAREALGK